MKRHHRLASNTEEIIKRNFVIAKNTGTVYQLVGGLPSEPVTVNRPLAEGRRLYLDTIKKVLTGKPVEKKPAIPDHLRRAIIERKFLDFKLAIDERLDEVRCLDADDRRAMRRELTIVKGLLEKILVDEQIIAMHKHEMHVEEIR